MTKKFNDDEIEIEKRLKLGAFYNLSAETQEEVIRWIKQNFRARKTIDRGHTAYGLKHILQRETDLYVTTFEFCDAMKECGFDAKQIAPENFMFKAGYHRPRTKQ